VNVLIVVPFFGGAKNGNPDVVDLAVELRKRGHRVVVLTTCYGEDKYYEEKNGVEVFRTRSHYVSRMDYSISFPFFKLRKLIGEFHIDIVHGIMEFGTQTMSATLMSSVKRKPFVLTIQGAATTFGAPHLDALMKTFDHSIARMMSLKASRVIILSERLSERAQKIGVTREKIRVVPTTIPFREEFNPEFFDSHETKKKLGFDEKLVIGFCGRLVRLKGLIFLLNALDLLQHDFDNLQLLVVGDGPERHYLESFAKEISLPTEIVGWVKRDEIPTYLSAVDIFVNPSLTEGLPLTVMEAMAMQKAVVATDVGGTSDLIRNHENGFLVPPSDIRSLATAIRTLVLDGKLRLDLGHEARKMIENNFDWNVIIPKVEKVYEEALR